MGKNDDKNVCMKTFIESLRCTESHYCRSDSPLRVYLPCDLNIKKLWNVYNEQAEPDQKVKQCYFRKYFNRKYNVGFGTPQTDLCSTCLQYKEKIRRCTDPKEKQSFITNHRVHTLQAKSFFAFLKQNSDEVVNISFDCQKNLPLPKLPDQQAYFSMQINFFNFGVVIDKGLSLTKENVRCYTWTKVERPKSSNEIASAIHHTLSTDEFKATNKIIRLFCDGCGGQNKNSIFIGMLCNWFNSNAPPNIEEIQVFFPVVGHSFMPPDRVFGNIEKVVRRTAEILEPSHYVNMIKDRATVFKMGVDFQVFDWKTEIKKTLKPTTQWHFKFKPAKRFVLTKNKLGTVLV
ncbi:uncharacterized protein LOC126741171 [Anthonomus grandis grandis]|uniref:uncharacterized protein LOC126741171 n=1 Tax=Anthonomus grandis grandis TaxID=2921223 RepID=UPI002165C7EC|nr:uncharacterized protein LOC126741171 [Anthonomus grandis grandis]